MTKWSPWLDRNTLPTAGMYVQIRLFCFIRAAPEDPDEKEMEGIFLRIEPHSGAIHLAPPDVHKEDSLYVCEKWRYMIEGDEYEKTAVKKQRRHFKVKVSSNPPLTGLEELEWTEIKMNRGQ